MLVRGFPAPGSGLTEVNSLSGEDRGFGLGFALLRLERGREFADRSDCERAYFLLDGEVEFAAGGRRALARRTSLLADLPTVLHVAREEPAEIRCTGDDADLVVFSVPNRNRFDARVLQPGDVATTRLETEGLEGTTERELRTVLDDEGAPHSAMTVGELVNLPGRWSSYPPHIHPHPEIYHYRFVPAHGFGYSQVGEEVSMVRSGDTALIPPNMAHPQVAAPGFAMVYAWGMPHLPSERFGAQSRRFLNGFDNLRNDT